MANAYTVSGFVDATAFGSVFTQDTQANTLTGNATSTGSIATANVGSYVIDVTPVTATTGYALTKNSTGLLTVDAAVVNLSGTRAYDATTDFAGATFGIAGTINTGVLGQTLAVASGLGTVASANVAAGTQTLTTGTLALGDGTGLASNYTLTGGTHTGTVTARNITLTANNATKIYRNANPALTFNVGGAGLAGADTITSVFAGVLARTAGENVAGSPYAINQGTLASNTNYSVTAFTPGQFTITPRALTIAADNKSKLTGDPLPPFSATYSGFVFADNPASLTGSLLFSTPATATSPAGAYVITPSGQSSSNYTVAYVNGTLTVSAAPTLPGSGGAGVSGIPTDVLTSIHSGHDPLLPLTVSGPSALLGLDGVQPDAATGGLISSTSGDERHRANGAVSTRVTVINGGVNLPSAITQ